MLEATQNRSVSRERATLSWHARVYLCIARLIRDSGALERLPGRTVADFYLWNVRNWTPFVRAVERAGGQELSRSLQSFRKQLGGKRTRVPR